MRSPCARCEHRHRDKDHPGCVQCDLRVAYVRALGGMSHSVPDRLMYFDQEEVVMGGAAVDVDEQERRARVRQAIEDVCRSVGISQTQLTSNSKSPEVCDARRRLVALFRDDLKMTLRETAERLDLSIATVTAYRAQTSGETGDKRPAASKTAPTKPAAGIDDALSAVFADFPSAREELLSLAAREMRTPSAQLAYLVRREYQGASA